MTISVERINEIQGQLPGLKLELEEMAATLDELFPGLTNDQRMMMWTLLFIADLRAQLADERERRGVSRLEREADELRKGLR